MRLLVYVCCAELHQSFDGRNGASGDRCFVGCSAEDNLAKGRCQCLPLGDDPQRVGTERRERLLGIDGQLHK